MKKAISLITLIITITVIFILTSVAIFSGISFHEYAKLAVFYNDVTAVQEVVTMKMRTNLIYYSEENGFEKYKWVGVAKDYTVEDIQNNQSVTFRNDIINNVNLVSLDDSLLESLSMTKELLGNYYVSDKGVVYHSGMNINGVVHYNSTSNSETGIAPATSIEPINPVGNYTGPRLADGSFIPEKGVNCPKMLPGMTAVYWEEDGTEITSANPSSDLNFDYGKWYSYEGTDENYFVDINNNVWANAKTSDGSYWVWIPRFSYSIVSGYNSATTGRIDIEFLKGNTNIGASGKTTWDNVRGQGKWNIHPAFYYTASSGETTQIEGYWMMKYLVSQEESEDGGQTWEMSNTAGVLTKAAGNSEYYRIVSKPQRVVWGYSRNFNNHFYSLLNYDEGIGLTGADAHMMRSIEYTAVAYLAHSEYGKNGTTDWSKYGSTNTGYENDGVIYSSTGNKSGVYDFSEPHTVALYCVYGYPSGWSALSNADNKYKECYGTFGNEPYGAAMYETGNNPGSHSAGSPPIWGGRSVQGFTCSGDSRCFSLCRSASFGYAHSHCAGDGAYSAVTGFGYQRATMWINY